MAVRQYKKLNLVLKWTIADRELSSDNVKFLKRLIAQKKAFNNVFNFIWVGTIVMLGIEYFRDVVMFAKIVLNNSGSHTLDISLCHNKNNTNPLTSDILAISLGLDNVISTGGFIIYFLPFIGVGIVTIYVRMWRLVKGIPRYRTRFHVF